MIEGLTVEKNRLVKVVLSPHKCETGSIGVAQGKHILPMHVAANRRRLYRISQDFDCMRNVRVVTEGVVFEPYGLCSP